MTQSQVFVLALTLLMAAICSAFPSRNYRYVHEDSKGFRSGPRISGPPAGEEAIPAVALQDDDDSFSRPLRPLGKDEPTQVLRNVHDEHRVLAEEFQSTTAYVNRELKVQPGAEESRRRARRDSIVVRPLGVTRLRDARRQQQRGNKSAKDQKSSKTTATSSRGLLKISPNK